MSVLIDPPVWPAHGTVFSHLVSDASLEELHAFARTAGLSPRAFDLDHYDVPAHRHADLVAAGAEEVSGAELVRRLVRSGLRVPARRRPARIAPVLRRRWERLFAGAGAHPDAVLATGQELLTRWAEEHRHYHSPAHLLAVLEALDELDAAGEDLGADPRAVRLAAWFHDAVYAADQTADPGQDEADSAELALHLLGDPRLRVPTALVAEVERLVLLTVDHRPAPGDPAGAALSDADLAVLGSSPQGYDRYVEAVRADFAHVADAHWRTGRAAVLQHLLSAEHLYATATGRARWEQPARQNLRRELEALRS
ncbi:DUF4031 domain-containing protein [Micrococcus sp. NPDC078436]|uniref:DUF4031 domain-containing protein n=1 Tax=Micrococcus sp. NPDC078436 TaxID=3154960 RepID=UPI00344BBE99